MCKEDDDGPAGFTTGYEDTPPGMTGIFACGCAH